MVSVLEYAPETTSRLPPIRASSAFDPPGNALISTLRPSSLKYPFRSAMITGR